MRKSSLIDAFHSLSPKEKEEISRIIKSLIFTVVYNGKIYKKTMNSCENIDYNM